MKKELTGRLILLPLLLLCAFFRTTGQTISNYAFQSALGTFSEISGGTVVPLTYGSADEGAYYRIPIGFAFAFSGKTYTSCIATTNGVLVFSDTITSYYGRTALSETVPLVAPLGDNHSMASGSFTYKSEVNGADSVFTAEWLNVKWRSTATLPSISFQVKLYKNSGKIEFLYASASGFVGGAASATVGINKGGTSAPRYLSLANWTTTPDVSSTTVSYVTGKPATGQMYAFTPVTTLSLGVAEDVFHASALLQAKINNGHRSALYGFAVGTLPNPVLGRGDVIDFSTLTSPVSGNYTLTVDGLANNTRYYYKAYVRNASGTTYSPSQDSFTTTGITAPIVKGKGMINAPGQMLYKGDIRSDGGNAVTASGIIYSTLPDPVLGRADVTMVSTTPLITSGRYDLTVSGLAVGTKYYYRFFATSITGTGYSAPDSLVMFNPVSSFPYADNFDSAAYGGWTTEGTVNDWVKGAPFKSELKGTYSAPNTWVTGLIDPHSNNHDGSLVSPVFDFSGMANDPVLEFRHRLYSENRSDGGIVEVSVNNGGWMQLDPEKGVTGNFNTASSLAWYNYIANAGSGIEGIPFFTASTYPYTTSRDFWILSQSKMNGLAGQSNVRFRFRFISNATVSYDGWMIDDVKVYESSAPTVSLNPATGIANTSVKLSATIHSGGLESGGKGFVVSTLPYDIVVEGSSVAVTAYDDDTHHIYDGAYTVSITGLSYPQKYYYRAFAINSMGTSYSAIDSFTTLDHPTAALNTKTILSDTSVSLSGDISYTGTAFPIITSGVVVSLNKNPVTGGAGVINTPSFPLVSNGTFTTTVTGLTRNTKYHYRFYARNSSGTIYSQPDSFTTFDIASVNINPVSNINWNSATLSGNVTSDGRSGITSRGVVFGTSSNPVIGGPGVIMSTTTGTTGTYTINVSGLTSYTKYYVRAFATNAAGTSYSPEITFIAAGVYNSFPYSENFDNFTANAWSSAAISSSRVNEWELGTPSKTYLNGAYSAPNAWVTKLSGDISHNLNAYVLSPVFDMSSLTRDPVLEFRHKFSFAEYYQGAVVEYSLNGGTTWTQLDAQLGSGSNYNTSGSLSWYNTQDSYAPSSLYSLRFAGKSDQYAGAVNGWIVSQVKLTGLAGRNNVRFRFNVAGSTYIKAEGWMIDDVKVYLPVAPLVTDIASSGLSNTNITISAKISNGGIGLNATGIVVSRDPDPAIGGPGVTDITGSTDLRDGVFSKTITGLSYPVKYYYKVYAINARGTSYSIVDSFQTPDVPSVFTRGASAVIDTSLTVSGEISYSGSGTPWVTGSGIVLSASPNPVIGGAGVRHFATSPVVTSGVFSNRFNGLTASTKYYYNVYVTNGFGTFYGTPDSLFTAGLAIVEKDTFADVEAATITFRGNIPDTGGLPLTASGVVISTHRNPLVGGSGVIQRNTSPVVGSGPFLVQLNGYTPYTKYYLRYFATNAAGTGYSALDSVIAAVPVATYPYAENFESASAGGWDTKYDNWLDGPAMTSNWELGTPSKPGFESAHSGTKAWVTKLSGNHDTLTYSELISPIFDLSAITGDAVLEFQHKFILHEGYNAGFVQYSYDGGLNWYDLDFETGEGDDYNTPNSTSWYNFYGFFSGNSNTYISQQNGWIRSKTMIPNDPGEQKIRIRFYFATESDSVAQGWMIDDVKMYAPTAAELTSVAATAVTSERAVLGGNISTNGGKHVTASGVVVSASSASLPVLGGSGVTAIATAAERVVSEGQFKDTITGLTENQKYYFRAYAINAIDTAYGNLDSFVAKDPAMTLPYFEDMESPTSDFWKTGGSANDWVKGAPSKVFLDAAYSGTNAWVTKLSGNYSNRADGSVVSPVFDLSSATSDPVLEFRHKFVMQTGGDGGIVEVSVNGGSWSVLDSVQGTGSNFSTANGLAWYNEAAGTGPLSSSARFSGSSTSYASADNGWILSRARLKGTAGQQNVRIRFRFASDIATVYEGWMIDDVALYEIAVPSTASNFVKGDVDSTKMTVNWTNGDGSGRIVVARLASAAPVGPADWKAYTADSVFGRGDMTGAGNYVVYNGTGASVTVTGLNKLTAYMFTIYDYNGSEILVRYGAASVSGGATTLPVTLTSFAAVRNGADVNVKWTTASEINNKGFDVERSVDGKSFSQWMFVEGENKPSAYSITDKDAFVKLDAPVLYYRLKQVDNSGNSTYSKVVSVSVSVSDAGIVQGHQPVRITPNPFADRITIHLGSLAAGVAIEAKVTDVMGKEVFSGIYHRNQDNSISIDQLAALKTGVYYIRISNGNDQQVHKIVKQ